MTIPSTEISALQSILEPHLPTGEQNKSIEAFHLELKPHSFRPRPKRFDTLSITAALGRWSDLKQTVKDQLINDIIARWQNFDPEETKNPVHSPETDATLSETLAPIEDVKDTASDQPASQPAGPTVKSPVSFSAPKRDWFDLITDFVALFFKPLYASD